MTLPTWDEYSRRWGFAAIRDPWPRPRGEGVRTAEQFWARTEIEAESGCWSWIGPYHTDGYGRAHLNGRGVMTHRAAWTFTHGDIPAGMWVLHRCDNRRCVNPDHLYLGTAADNGRDKAARIAAEKAAGGKSVRIDPWQPSIRRKVA